MPHRINAPASAVSFVGAFLLRKEDKKWKNTL
nr:MAG TPA: hypothetical protein [Caudoviricetes sp.]